MTNEISAPKKSKGDIAHAVVKAGIGSVPVVGSAAAEFFQMLITPPLEKRREEWMQAVSEKLMVLEEKGVAVEALQENEQFISTLMQATQIAMRTHQREKIDALRNAVLNAAKPQPPGEALQQIFLNLIDSMTEWHLRMLKLFHNPPPVHGLSMGGLSSVLEHHYPDLRGKRDFYDQVWKDLYLRGLVSTEHMHTTMSEMGLRQQRTTTMGAQFLAFVEE